MKQSLGFLVQFLLTALLLPAYGQDIQYFLLEESPEFSSIESLLLEEEADSVIVLADAFLATTRDPKKSGIAHFYKGQAEAAMGHFGMAHRSYDEAGRHFRSIGFEEGLAMVCAKTGDVYASTDDAQEAETYYDRAIQYSEEQKLYEVLVDVYQKKAIIHTLDAPETAIDFLKHALQYALLQEDETQAINIINQISTNYHMSGELDSAILYFQESLRLKDRLDDPAGLISDHSALGSLYRERGDYENAQRELMAALGIAEAQRDSFAITTAYSGLGDIYAAQNVWDVSEDYYHKAIVLARIKSSRFMEAGCLKRLGQVFLRQGRDSAAIASYESALDLYTQLGSKVNVAEVLVQLSQIYHSPRDFIKVRSLLEETLKTSQRSQDVMSALSTKLALADIEIKLGNYQTGISYADECLTSFRNMEDKENLRRVTLLLSQAHAQLGNYRQAYEFHQEYGMLNDSLVSVERAAAIKK
ncbi:MAG: tetratricopeptide repeat protein, partial [Saprospiraceae bacterium]|nr:tetratricopeptide repeat protein [Saprospiraceae bacterium]